VSLEDLARGLWAVEIGHADVHQDDVGAEFVGEPDAHPSTRRLGDDLDVLLRAEQRREPGPKQVVVIDNEHANRFVSRIVHLRCNRLQFAHLYYTGIADAVPMPRV
jgi:hypothetical protein